MIESIEIKTMTTYEVCKKNSYLLRCLPNLVSKSTSNFNTINTPYISYSTINLCHFFIFLGANSIGNPTSTTGSVIINFYIYIKPTESYIFYLKKYLVQLSLNLFWTGFTNKSVSKNWGFNFTLDTKFDEIDSTGSDNHSTEQNAHPSEQTALLTEQNGAHIDPSRMALI